MAITQRVRDTLTRAGIPQTGTTRDGYRVEDGPDGSAIVRWGYGQPFQAVSDVPTARNGKGLAQCARALRHEFRVGRGEHTDSHGLYIVVTERPQQG